MTDIVGWNPSDYTALVNMAYSLGAPAEWFAAVMMSESSMQASAQNSSGCVGLIQFCSPPVANMTSMTPAQQMPYVANYYLPKVPAGGFISRAQIYQANYLPATIAKDGSDPSAVISTKGDGLYQGVIFDHTNKGYTTVGDLEYRLAQVTQGAKWQAVLDGIQAAGGSQPVNTPSSVASFVSSDLKQVAAIALAGTVVGAAGWYIYINRDLFAPHPITRRRRA